MLADQYFSRIDVLSVQSEGIVRVLIVARCYYLTAIRRSFPCCAEIRFAKLFICVINRTVVVAAATRRGMEISFLSVD